MSTAPLPKQTGQWLRTWTRNSIRRSGRKERMEQLEAAQNLKSIPSQPFPSAGFRVIEVDTSLVRSWKDLANHLDSSLPESCSYDLKGAKSFLRNASGGHINSQAAGTLLLRIETSKWMFNLPCLVSRLPLKEQLIEDKAGFSLKEYLSQKEVVAEPGALLQALKSGKAYLYGHARPHTPMVFKEPRRPLKV